MRILITGINGFIGRHLAKRLIERGHKVWGVKNEKGGVINKKVVERAVGGADIVIHLAALTSHKDIVENKLETLETNLAGTKNVLEAFIKSKTTKKFLYASTGKVYGKIVHLPITETHPTNPLNILGKSKLITENLIDFYSNQDKEFVIFRIFNIYGPGQSEDFLIPTILKQLEKGNKLVLGDIKAKRDCIYIDDVVDAFVKVIEQKGLKGLSIFNLASGKSFSAAEIVKMIGKIKGANIKVKSDLKKVRHDEMKDEYGSFTKAKKTFGWEPKISLQKGLEKIINGDMQAIVMAGGKGTRMQKQFPNTPKLLIPVLGKPYLDYLVSYLKKYDCRNIIISAGYLGEQVRRYLARKKFDVAIKLSIEKKPLGSGGALNIIKGFFEENFFLLFGDAYTTVNYQKMFAFHKKNRAIVTAVVHESHHPEDSDLVEFDTNGKITKIIKKPHGLSGKNHFNLGSQYIVGRGIQKYLTTKYPYDFEHDVLTKLLDENLPIYAYNTPETIMDFGTPERLERLEKLLRK